MKMSIGDIIDRYSICKLKTERLQIDNSSELNELYKEIEANVGSEEFVSKLYEINGKIWDLEADIRKENEDILGLEEVGRRALKIRDYNKIRVQIKNDVNSKFNQGFVEYKMNHGSYKEPSIIISLTTVPERLSLEVDDGLKLVLKHLCEQNDDDYEVHFNIPYESFVTKKKYVIPQWLDEYKLKYSNLKIFRTDDEGPPTKFVPTLRRIKNSETILLVVDDDLVYHKEMVKEHRKYQSQFVDHVICYEGRGSDVKKYQDIRDDWVLCVVEPTITHNLQHYKSASYKKKLFGEDFYKLYLGKTFSDDVLVSSYFYNNFIKMVVVPYEPDNHLFETREAWDKNSGVTSFPVLRYASSVQDTGCNHPDLLKIQGKFYTPDEFNNMKAVFKTDKYDHGYFAFYNPIFNNYKHALNILEIGIQTGASLKMLEYTFKNATIYGLDIDRSYISDSPRIKTLHADQANREQLKEIFEKLNVEFDIIIDDGGHFMRLQQISFGFLFKYLKTGGVYIIEDLHSSKIFHCQEKDDKITTLDMLEKYQKDKIIWSNYMLDEEMKYINENVKQIDIWTATPEKNRSVTSAIYK